MNFCIGVKLNDEMKAALSTIQNKLKEEEVAGRYVYPDDLHLKIADIGEFDKPEKIKEALKSLQFDPFAISLLDVDKRLNHWWVEVDRNKELQDTVRKVRRDLAVGHVPFDRKIFLPRVTLLREHEPDGLKVPYMLKRKLGIRMTVDHLSLICTDAMGHAAVYDEIQCRKPKNKQGGRAHDSSH